MRDKYLRNEIDSISKRLENVHHNFINCQKGCDLCCSDFKVFLIVFYTILNNLKEKYPAGELISNDNKNDDNCIFLENHNCTIYNSRSTICRTHGLPLLFANDEGEWELLTCELNFTDFDFQKFTHKNTFPMDVHNSRLFQLNKKFIACTPEFTEFDLIPLKDLKKELINV